MGQPSRRAAAGRKMQPSLVRHPVARLAVEMLRHNRTRSYFAIGGVALAFFLAAAQFGLLVGWINTNTALIRHAGADLWVLAPHAPAFDYGTAIPRRRLYQARSVPGVAWAEPLFMAWNIWKRPDGRRVNVELVGLSRNSLLGGPWKMAEGELAVLRRPKTVVVDELYAGQLGLGGLGGDLEMMDRRARVGGLSSGVRTLTASPFVFTSIEEAIRYDKRYSDDEITFVLAKCLPGVDVRAVQADMRRRLPHVEVLTAGEFAFRSARYWMLETGVGIMVLVTAALGLGVGTAITSQTLYAITHEHLTNYATLLAIGFRRAHLVGVVLVQSGLLGAAGIVVGALVFALAAIISARTPIPLETTRAVFGGLVMVSLLSCAGASWLSLRSILRLDPVEVFQR
jgi:putative ABC transport system permease protein